jgi:hypothetical protein
MDKIHQAILENQNCVLTLLAYLITDISPDKEALNDARVHSQKTQKLLTEDK